MMVTEGMGHVNIVAGKVRFPANLTGVPLEIWTNAVRGGAHPQLEVKEPPVMAALCALRQTYPRPAYASTGRRDAAALGLKLVLIVGITSSFLGIA